MSHILYRETNTLTSIFLKLLVVLFPKSGCNLQYPMQTKRLVTRKLLMRDISYLTIYFLDIVSLNSKLGADVVDLASLARMIPG